MSKSRSTIASRILAFALALFALCVAAELLLNFLARAWPWLLLIAGLGAAGWVTAAWLRARRDRW